MEFFIGAETYTFKEILNKDIEGSIDLTPLSSKDYQKVLNLLGDSFSSNNKSKEENEKSGLKLMSSDGIDALIKSILKEYGSNIQGIDIIIKKEPLEKRIATIEDIATIGFFFHIRFSILMFLFNKSTLGENDIEKVKKP